MKMLFPLIVLLAISLVSCDENTTSNTDVRETVDLTLTFKGTFGDEPLRMFEGEYDYEDNMKLRLQLFQFYISHLQLLDEDKSAPDDSISLVDIDLVSFKDIISSEDAARGVQIVVNDVPVGTYKGLRMGLGVSPDFNATQPGDYTPPHPLDDHYWSWARGYVFTKVEGNADLDGDGTFEEKLTFHLGENQFFRNFEVTQPLVVGPTNQEIVFEVDLKRVLSDGSGKYVDFRQVTQDHTNDMELVGFMMDNLQQAIEIQ